MHQATERKTMTSIFATLLLMLACTVQPATALPPKVEADRLLLSAAEKMDQENYSAAGQDIDKIKSLGVRLPVEFHYQNGRYLAGMQNAVEAKKSLETYFDKAGKEGKFYQGALKLYSQMEAADEKRRSRFKDNDDGTVTDTKTGLMLATKINGTDINWPDAEQYCVGFSGGGHKDWRLPTQNELAELYEQVEAGNFKLMPVIKSSNRFLWAAETRDTKAAGVHFGSGAQYWSNRSYVGGRVLPVRGGE